MKAIEFPEYNYDLAKNQPQYTPLPVFADMKVFRFRDPYLQTNFTKELPNSMTVCYEMSDEEINELIRTKKIWYRQMLFGEKFHPVFLSTKSPFLLENKQHWPEDK